MAAFCRGSDAHCLEVTEAVVMFGAVVIVIVSQRGHRARVGGTLGGQRATHAIATPTPVKLHGCKYSDIYMHVGFVGLLIIVPNKYFNNFEMKYLKHSIR